MENPDQVPVGTNRMVKRRASIKAQILLIATVSLTGILIAALMMLTVTFIHYRQDETRYADARALAVQTTAPLRTRSLMIPPPEPTVSLEPEETPPIQVDFAALRKEGKNVLGWLYSANTLINYPITYYSNNTYYLSHDYTGTRSEGGALFFDCRLTKQLIEQNIIIYGHHMKNRSMFGGLLQYQKQTYYDEHPTMYLLTPEKNYRIELFAAQFTNSEQEQFPVWFESEQQRETYVQTAMATSTFTCGDIEYHPEDQIISLVTCAYSDYIQDAKFQVIGWLIEIG